MASSASPGFHDSEQPGPHGGLAHQREDKDPLSSLNFLKTLSEKKKARDGKPPKRRGPKPDSKPALTRRQELNRQAQRTHRERKELYIKTLEDELLRLKEAFTNVSQDKDKLAEENRHLKTLLRQNGISYEHTGESPTVPSLGYTSSPSVSGNNYQPGSQSAFTPPLTSQSLASSMSPPLHVPLSAKSNLIPPGISAQQLQHSPAQRADVSTGIDYEQAGIDFVLSLEKPCMEHLGFLMERSAGAGGSLPSGHAMMASCPPQPFTQLTPDIPFGYGSGKGDCASRQRTWELSKGDLATLLDLSKKLDLDGEITPVMAWGMILAHPRLGELGTDDFTRLADELRGKVRCYGFGAVMEEFEVRDALENIFSRNQDAMGMAY
ncbi:hypothetical protein VUR80DRAFT_3033 [Thermomyces stellatus]